MIPLVNLKRQYTEIKGEIDSAIDSVLENARFIKGEVVERFERNFAALNGNKYCLSVGNGTDSLFIIMKALGIGVGDEVITVSNTWISSSETISLTGAKPVFADTDDFYTMSVDSLRKSVTTKTKAVVLVHLYGQVADLELIQRFCEENGLHLIEDCAQAHFAEYRGTFVGNFGIAASFSFFPGKNLGAYGDAGGIVTDDYELFIKMKMFANHGALVRHEHQIEGINSRMDTLQAAVLDVKLKYILEWTNRRRENAKIYTEGLRRLDKVETPQIRANTKHSFHLYVIKVERREELAQYLQTKGISTSIHYPTILPDQPCYKDYKHYVKYANSRADSGKILSLPMCSNITLDEIRFIINSIEEFYSSYL